jgi:hypothetical protein
MEICVAGWYFKDNFIEVLNKVYPKYKITIVSHLDSDSDFYYINRIPVLPIPNIGLEFGIYDYYLKKIWDGKSRVLFIHDDTEVEDPNVFDAIAGLRHDCAYLFRDMAEEKANGGKHGRAIVCSPRFLDFVRNFTCDCMWLPERDDPHNRGQRLPKLEPHKGFWFDPYNKGHVSGKPPFGIRHYNEGIYHFHWFLGRIRDQRCGPQQGWPNPKIKMDVVNRVMIGGLLAGRRGCWKHVDREKRRYNAQQQVQPDNVGAVGDRGERRASVETKESGKAKVQKEQKQKAPLQTTRFSQEIRF